MATLANPATMRDPFDYYRFMRESDPVHFDEQAGAYLISRYEDVRKALRLTDVFSSELGFSEVRKPAYQQEVDEFMRREGFGPFVLNFTVDPPEHTRRRALVDQAFSARRVTGMEGYMHAVVNELIDAFIGRGEAELVGELAIPIPVYVIADALGVPRERIDDFRTWSEAAVANTFNPGITREQALENARHLVDMQHYLVGEIEDRQTNPRGDMISDLVRARLETEEHGQEQLSRELLLSMIQALLVAGNETTTNGLSFALMELASDADLFASLKDSPKQDNDLQRFVEESLRVHAPVPQLPRVTRQDVEIGGTLIPKGSWVYLCYASANRDGGRFHEPESFDLKRKGIGLHLTFGGGIHRCIGAMLARMEMKVGVREVIRRLDNLQLVVPREELEVVSLFATRGLKALPVRFSERQSQ